MTINVGPYRDEPTPPEDFLSKVFDLIENDPADISAAEVEVRLNRTLADAGYALEDVQIVPPGDSSVLRHRSYHPEVSFHARNDPTCLDHREGFNAYADLITAIKHAREDLRQALASVGDAERRAADVTMGVVRYADAALDQIQEQKTKAEEKARSAAAALLQEAQKEASRIIAAAEQRAIQIVVKAEQDATHAHRLSEPALYQETQAQFRTPVLAQAQACPKHLSAPVGSGNSEASVSALLRHWRMQPAVDTAIRRFAEHNYAGLHLEKPIGARDPNIRTIRIDRFHRGVVLCLGEGKYALLDVLPHDDALAFAVSRQFTLGQSVGTLQMRDQAGIEPLAPAELASPADGLFGHVSTAEFARLGVNEKLVPLLRNVGTDQQLESLTGYLPEAQLDILRGLSSGMTVAEVWAELADRIVSGVGAEDLLAAVRRTPYRGIVCAGVPGAFSDFRMYVHRSGDAPPIPAADLPFGEDQLQFPEGVVAENTVFEAKVVDRSHQIGGYEVRASKSLFPSPCPEIADALSRLSARGFAVKGAPNTTRSPASVHPTRDRSICGRKRLASR